MVAALESLAVVAPDGLVSVVPADWFLRYSRRVENFRLPREEKERHSWANQVGYNGLRLRAAVDAAEDLPYLKEVPMVQTLRQVWTEQFEQAKAGSGDPPQYKAAHELPPASEQLVSRFDTQARFATKREIRWVGYRVEPGSITVPDEDDNCCQLHKGCKALHLPIPALPTGQSNVGRSDARRRCSCRCLAILRR